MEYFLIMHGGPADGREYGNGSRPPPYAWMCVTAPPARWSWGEPLDHKPVTVTRHMYYRKSVTEFPDGTAEAEYIYSDPDSG